jgi:Asp-tRNA(Asn)/Glu-tRNA(Gln) amidotransferase A subunit family amidase
MEPYELTATQAVALLKQRQLSCEELTLSCLRRIERRDSEVQAWIAVDPELALARARVLDASTAVAPLKGLPIGFKDIIATSDLPTCYNSPLYAKQKIGRDAACVTVVRECGGTVLGKTDTVEFASGARRARTRNPHNLSHTPGGSSSGSAAAVADFHVPLSFGTQTGGSIIRPAAFNGIYAIKPTHGLASYEGIKHVAPSLDTLGWYGRAIDDLRLVADALRFHLCRPRPAQRGTA